MPPRFAPALVERVPRDGGGFVLRSPTPLAPYARCLGDLLEQWAVAAPERTFVAERDASGDWRRVSYREARAAVWSIAQALIDLGLGPTRPLVVLSDNGVDHALVALGAMHAGIPVAPLSTAYSLQSADHARLRELVARLDPGAVFAADGATYARALAAVADVAPRAVRVTVAELTRASPGDAAARAFAAVGPDTIAKILFTSGSTGTPKGVVNTQRMLCSNQQAIAQVWPFVTERPPVLVDWLPWSHTFGGNHNFNLVLRNGGTLHVDAGKPAPQLIDRTVRNLREISPTIYFNVPRGYDMLLGALESDAALRTSFYRELDLIFYAAAALPQHLWDRLARLSDVTMVSAWGSTETAPMVTTVHFPIPRAGVIGLPAPGCELALVPERGKLAMRVRGPNVTPGTWQRGGTIAKAPLDEHGFPAMGDAGRLEDETDPARGVVFAGRTEENFKLDSGTFVHVTDVRLGVISACAPLVQDLVVTGHDRAALGALIVLAPSAAPDAAALTAKLAAWNAAHPASSQRIARALIMTEPPSIDAGEITDKGYLNQAAVLARRAALVERLYAAVSDPEVLRP